MYESTNYHAIAHLTGHIEGAAKYNSAPKTKASKKIWYYTVKDAAGKTWYHGKGTDVAKKMKVTPQRLSGAASFGFKMLGQFTVTREEMERNEDLH